MLTIKSITNGVATITLDVDNQTYVWTVGGLEGIENLQEHLERNQDQYRQDIRNTLALGQTVKVADPKQDILDELAALDTVLPRAIEDVVAASGLHDSLPEIMQQRIARKTELRKQLAAL